MDCFYFNSITQFLPQILTGEYQPALCQLRSYRSALKWKRKEKMPEREPRGEETKLSSRRRWRKRRMKVSWSWEGNLAEEGSAPQTVLR